jgi:hypothetical protein
MNSAAPIYEPADLMGGLYGDGIIGLKGAFSPEWGGSHARGH